RCGNASSSKEVIRQRFPHLGGIIDVIVKIEFLDAQEIAAFSISIEIKFERSLQAVRRPLELTVAFETNPNIRHGLPSPLKNAARPWIFSVSAALKHHLRTRVVAEDAIENAAEECPGSACIPLPGMHTTPILRRNFEMDRPEIRESEEC